MAKETDKHLVYSTKTKKFSKYRRPLSKSMIRQIKEGIKEASDPSNWIIANNDYEWEKQMEELCRR